MLSKSQARLFFVVTTAGFSAVFLGLTVDTLRQVPERSNEHLMTAEVVHGKEIWEDNNCMGCHTLLGEGAYYAPELTKVVERRGKEWLRLFLKDPQGMFPGERKMVQYDLSEPEIEALIAFLEWNGNIDTNGFPRDPDMAPKPVVAAGAASLDSAPGTFAQLCTACHSVGGTGGKVGPALDGVGSRFADRAALDQWIADPQSVKPGTAMPKMPLTDDQRAELVDWLLTLK